MFLVSDYRLGQQLVTSVNFVRKCSVIWANNVQDFQRKDDVNKSHDKGYGAEYNYYPPMIKATFSVHKLFKTKYSNDYLIY